MWCWRKMLGVSWREHRTNKSIFEELDVERELMAKVVKLKLQYFGHVARGSAGQLALTVLEGSMEGTSFQGKPRRQWLNDIEDWTGYKGVRPYRPQTISATSISATAKNHIGHTENQYRPQLYRPQNIQRVCLASSCRYFCVSCSPSLYEVAS